MDKNTFGQWIRQMRDTRRMTREDLIAALRGYGKVVAPSTLTTWENGGVNAPIHDPEFVQAIAKVFGVTGADVLIGSGYQLGEAYENLNEDERLLLMAYQSGDLDRLVRAAISGIDNNTGRHGRLQSKDDDTNEGTKGTANVSRR